MKGKPRYRLSYRLWFNSQALEMFWGWGCWHVMGDHLRFEGVLKDGRVYESN